MSKSRGQNVGGARARREASRSGQRRSGGRSAAAKSRRRPFGFLSFFGHMPVLIAGGIVLLSGVLIYAVVQAANPPPPGPSKPEQAELNSDAGLPGEYVMPHPGPDGKYGTNDDAQHMAEGVSMSICSSELTASDSQLADVNADRTAIAGCYNSNPPTSGPMSEQTGGFRVYQNPIPKEVFVHTMEHAGVVVWYNTADAEVKKELEAVVKDQLDRRRLVAMVPYPEMEPDTIAVTAWTRLEKFPVSEFSKKRVEEFIETHNKRYNPEGF